MNQFVFAQDNRQYAYQVGGQTDNDSYAFTGRDRYYSNGLFFSFRKAIDSKNYATSNNIVKKIYGFELGHEIFMPFTAQKGYYSEDLIDRPYAGYIYLKGMYDFFYKKESALNLSASLGLIGPSTGVDKLQSWVHDAFGYYEPQGWEHQIKNSYGIDFTATYKKVFIKNSLENRRFDCSFIGEARLGTFFIGASAGVLLRAGGLEKMFNSAVFNAKPSSGGEGALRNSEWSFYALPMLSSVVYDATIQGNIFEPGPLPNEIIKEPQRLVFSQQIGFLFTERKFGLDISYNYRSKEVVNVIKASQFGSIKFFYFFN
nr:lipid A deacylase LpxR family protein [Solitalea canadensis]